MSNRFGAALVAMATVVAVLLLAPRPVAGPTSLVSFVGVAASAQGFGEPRRSSIERSRAEASGGGAQVPTAAAKTWNLPRTPDGQPDVQGYWYGGPDGASHSIEEGCCEPIQVKMQRRTADRIGLQEQIIVDPVEGRIPYQPWAAAKRRENLVNMDTPTKLQHIDTEDRCLLLGVPRSNYRGDLEIRQAPGHVVILSEWAHAYRIIPVDRRPHVGQDIKLYNGDSRGHWDGNTLVVDATNFNDKVWFDSHGSFYSDALHVVERWTFIDADTIKYEATIEDPSVFTQPWKIAFPLRRNKEKGYEFLEEACHEGVSLEHRLAAGRLAVAAGKTGIHTHDEEK